MTRLPDDSDPSRRPPDYVIVVSASDWLKDRFPAAAASLTDALQASDHQRVVDLFLRSLDPVRAPIDDVLALLSGSLRAILQDRLAA